MAKLASLTGEKSSNQITANTQSALYSGLLAGRTYKGEFNQDKTYSRGDIVVYNDPVNGPTLYEATTDIESGTKFNLNFWAKPAVGSPFCNYGVVILSNTQEFPFNDSAKTITMAREMDSQDYIVLTSCNDQNIDEIEVFNKMVNCFDIRYYGTAPVARVTYAVLIEGK